MMNTIEGIMNHTLTINRMIKEELEQDKKHLANKRCKPANWNRVASYIEYATGVKCTGEEVKNAYFVFK